MVQVKRMSIQKIYNDILSHKENFIDNEQRYSRQDLENMDIQEVVDLLERFEGGFLFIADICMD